MIESSAKYIHALRSLPGIGNGTLSALLAHFETGEKAWLASPQELAAVPKLRPDKRSLLITGRENIDPDQLWDNLANLGITLHTRDDATYPKLLREIPDSPHTLYTRGTFHWEHFPPTIAIVGSRKHSSYGEQAATTLAADLTRAGFLVVSGMAFGIDSHAHRGALEAGGETLAVLGSGIDDSMISPVSHFPLAKKIMGHGALVSEYPPGTPASQGSFPMRDRIIAGLCLGTVVIEAPETSGSLITARCALEYNREVFAVPGSIFSPYSIGTNHLIQRGAKGVMGVQDILEEFPQEQLTPGYSEEVPSPEHTNLSTEEKIVLATLTHEPLHVDKIIKATKLQTAQASSILALLEIKGLVKNIGGMHYVRQK